MKTLARCFWGFAIGWVVYMVAMILTVYDGLLSLIFQPFMAALFSGVFVVGAFLVGLVLRLPKVRGVWNSMGWWALGIPLVSLGVMIFHAPLGLQTEFTDFETGQTFMSMSPSAGITCYSLAIFAIVNFPRKRKHGLPPH